MGFTDWYRRCRRSGLQVAEDGEHPAVVSVRRRQAELVGYLLKDRVADVGEFVEALNRVAAGGTALDPEVVTRTPGAPPSDQPKRRPGQYHRGDRRAQIRPLVPQCVDDLFCLLADQPRDFELPVAAASEIDRQLTAEHTAAHLGRCDIASGHPREHLL